MKVDLDEMRDYVKSRTPHENMLALVEELALARAVVEAAGEFENHRLFPKRDDPEFGKADGSVWLGLNKMRDALAAYARFTRASGEDTGAKVGGTGK